METKIDSNLPSKQHVTVAGPGIEFRIKRTNGIKRTNHHFIDCEPGCALNTHKLIAAISELSECSAKSSFESSSFEFKCEVSNDWLSTGVAKSMQKTFTAMNCQRI